MNRYRHSKSGLFLMELLINILFFSILITFCMQIFAKAHRLSNDTQKLHQAVTICSSIAQICQSTDSSTAEELLLSQYPDAAKGHNCTIIFFDNNFIPCSRDNSLYTASVSLNDEISEQSQVIFTESNSADSIYTLSFCTYIPASANGGALNE